MATTTLVTGAAGFAGGHLLDLLAANGGTDITAWHRPGASPPSEPRSVRWRAIDLLDRQAVERGVSELKPEQVYHCAGAAHVGRAWDHTESTFAINVRGTHHLIEALGRARVRCRVLVPGSALVYAAADRPLSESDPLAPSGPYGVSKLAQEMFADHAPSGVEVMIARAFNHTGPRQDPSFAASGFARRIAEV